MYTKLNLQKLNYLICLFPANHDHDMYFEGAL